MKTQSHRMFVLAALAAGCGTQQVGDIAPPENDPAATERVQGSVEGDQEALVGDGLLAEATEVVVLDLDADGSAVERGRGDIAADGSFDVAVTGTARTFVLQAVDAEGSLLGAAVVTTADAEATVVAAGEVTAETTVEAMTWTSLVAHAGVDAATSAEVRSRVDVEVAAAVNAWFDAHEGSSLAFEAVAEATVSASIALRDELAGAEGDIAAQVRAAFVGADDEASLGAGLEAALEAGGVVTTDRSAAAARVEATFRAMVAGSLDDDTTVDALADVSSHIEAWAHVEAWSDIEADGGGELAADVSAMLTAAAESDDADAVVDLQAELGVRVRAVVEGLLDSDADLAVALRATLGLEAGADEGDAVDAMDALIVDVRSDVHADLVAAAGEVHDGEADAEATAQATAEAYAALEASLAASSTDDDATLAATLSLAAGAFVDAR